ncbi:MAG: ATP-binding protein [Actinomycetota bacterium]|nr:ATP-binding protein [Actinomycetota bacterium]
MAATSAPRKAAKPLVGKVERDLQLAFDSGNEPNADILMRSLRVSGYTLEGTLEDLVDNSVDAGAKMIVVHLERDGDTDEWTLYVGDDGSGMSEAVLDQMMRLGSRVDHDLDSDLGAFGVGSDTATLAIARRKHVVTVGEDGPLSAIWDLDVVEQERRFVKHLGEASSDEKALFEDAFHRYGVVPPDAGTVVLVGKADRVNRTQVPTAARSVVRSFGSTYRRFLKPNGELEIVVNGEPVRPTDPLMRDNPETEVLFEDEVKFGFPDAEGKKRTERFGVAVAHVPDFGGVEANKKAGISIETSGFYIIRNNREIVPHTSLGLYKRHNELSRFRVEVSFPGSMDEQLGVTFLKSAVDLNPSQALKDKIKEVVFPYRRQSQDRYRKSKKDADIQVPHDEAAKHIRGKAPLLRTPEAETDGGGPDDKGRNGEKPGVPSEDGKPGGQAPTLRQRLATEAIFQAKDLGDYAPFYEPGLDGKKVVVTYNAQHPAYERLILENRENRGQLTAIDFLVWSLASAELRAVDDEQSEFAARMREDMSFNLKQLLKL